VLHLSLITKKEITMSNDNVKVAYDLGTAKALADVGITKIANPLAFLRGLMPQAKGLGQSAMSYMKGVPKQTMTGLENIGSGSKNMFHSLQKGTSSPATRSAIGKAQLSQGAKQVAPAAAGLAGGGYLAGKAMSPSQPQQMPYQNLRNRMGY
jgi:hypothetical protein